MDQFERGACLPNTRLDAIKSISDWYADGSDEQMRVMWIYGQAGTGKSTLSTTIAHMMDRIDGINLLGAFFFFDRDISERNASSLIRTIAYQLAEFDPSIGAKIEQVIESIPNIGDMPPAVQFSKLLSASALGDIQWNRGPVLIIIDALDESDAGVGRKKVLQVLSEGFSSLPHFLRLLIVSRPERDIFNAFEKRGIHRQELVADSTSQSDIMELIRTRLLEVRQDNIGYLVNELLYWPTEEEILALAIQAAGLFIWAATACRLIDESHNPKDKLDELVQDLPVANSASIFMSLYKLYETALRSAGNWNDASFRSDVLNILGAITCARVPLSCIALDSLLRLPRPSMLTVSRLRSVLRGSGEEPIRMLHTSFFDYLTLRELVEPWAIDGERHNVYMADRCLVYLDKELHENMCGLTIPYPAQEAALPESVTYASKYWIEHVCLVTGRSLETDLCDRIYQFLEQHAIHWLETLSIMKAFDVALQQLPKLLAWVQVSRRNIPTNTLLTIDT